MAGAVVGATVATAAASSNSDAATTNAYDAGSRRAAHRRPPGDTYAMGALYPELPAGCIEPNVKDVAYYLCGNTWFEPTFGANGVYYKVVPAP